MAVVGQGLGLGLAVALAVLGLLAGYAWTVRADPEAPLSLRAVGTVLLAAWLACLGFAVLGSVGGFSRAGLGGVLLLAALLGVRGAQARIREAWQRDLQAVVALRVRWADPLLWVSVVVAGGFAVRVVRALVRPPLGTDALTYHLVRAGRFVQTGAFAIEPTPDAGGYYAYYPPLGDALWAVTMLPTGSDALLGWMNAAAMLALALAAFAAANALGAPRRVAAWGTLALVATPAVMSWSSAAYVDTFLLAAIAAAVAWMPRAVRLGSPWSLAMVAAGVSLAAGIKTTGIVPLGLAGVLLLGVLLRRTPKPQRTRAVAMGLVAMLVAGPGLLHAWADHGNPLYPFPVQLAGHVLLPGNEENALLHRGALFPAEVTHFELGAFVRTLVWPRATAGVQHLNFGPFAVPVVLLAAAGIAWFRGADRRWATGVVLVTIVAVFGLKLTSDETLLLRTASSPAIGRFLTVPWLVVVLAATRAPPRLAIPVFGLAALGGTWLSLPRGLGPADLEALRQLAPALGVVALAGLAMVRLRGRIRVGLAALALIVFAVWALALRPGLRDCYYAEAYAAAVYDPHPVDPKAAAAHPIWAWLERQPDGLRIAFASGWDGRGHHWYRSPLLGSKLQHQLVYVSPTADGELIDYRLQTKLAAAADRQAWLRRLQEQRVDLLVLCVPQGPEHTWAVSMPQHFEVVEHGVDDLCLAFDVNLDVPG